MMQAIDSVFSRRAFVGGLLTAPAFLPAIAVGRGAVPPPSERIHMGLIGCGLHGAGWNLDQMFGNVDQQVVAVCDVDTRHAAHAERRVNQHYSELLRYDYRCRVDHDFRQLINAPDIDAVCIATPDHWHVPIAVMALRAGKHVICEKPLSLTIAEGRLLADEARSSGRVFQTASENRSIDSYIRICELVRGGYIGELRHMKVLLEKGNAARGNDDFRVQPPPEHLDYDMWQGPAATAPYCPARVHVTYRWNQAYSGGRLTDWGAHLIDLAQWASGNQHTGPVEVEGTGKFPPRDAVWNTPEEFDLHYRYANGVTMHVWSEVPGIKFEGSDGWIMFRGWRKPLRASNPKLLCVTIPDHQRLHRPRTVIQREDELTGGEHLDFTDVIRRGGTTCAPAEVGHRTATVCHLGNIAMQRQQKLTWDPESERFLDNPAANAMLSRPQRDPWTIDHVDSWIAST